MTRPARVANSRRPLRMRRQGSKQHASWGIAVPIDIVAQIRTDYLYKAELVPEGILFRVIGTEVIEPPKDWPS